ncbi:MULTISPECIES: toll/interleukin-1 receptor domain-containing protein [Sphingomonas]|uniref:toll/interleukin-1 receptor domain-containing protein n=1 Tax=Sphingomonas TaxID=13687 RepID=UPI000DEF1340|nr:MULTISPECIES: toll/interleukin-1 receptor domain-containing protein [Sphingomonas]
MDESALLSRSRAGRSRKPAARKPFVQRYWAFLSYSHADAGHADWLHRALERFRVPPELVGRRTERFLVPRTLAPIFQDRSELAASGDLGGDINDMIEGSRHLIVLCSPATVASRWVNAEIRAFKRLRPDGKVLAAIVGGEPHSADPASECLPAALSERYDARGRLVGDDAEPIAADLRAEADGRDMGLLKLVAGMLDVRLDELVQREEQQRHRRWMLVSAGSIAGMLLTTGLAVVALQARDEARDQRRQAESLVGFMIGDLKDKLEPVGRLDALDAVGGKVLNYYEHQDKAGLSDEALGQRSRALTLMGDIAQRRGDLARALALYREGLASTTEALRRDPANPQRLFDQAQNVFWIGNLAATQGRYDEAGARFTDYRALADRMIAAEPANVKWQLEGIYADSNLGVLALQTRHSREAATRFGHVLKPLGTLRRADPANADYASLEIEARGDLADALERSGQLPAAVAERMRQLATLQQALAPAPDNSLLLEKELVALRSLAREQAAVGDRVAALAISGRGVALADLLVRRDPANGNWASSAAGARLEHAALLLRQGQLGAAATFTEAGCKVAERLNPANSAVLAKKMRRKCLDDRARLSLAQGAAASAMLTAGQLIAEIRNDPGADPIDARFALARAQSLAGDIAAAMGDRASAMTAWNEALATWPITVEQTPTDLAQRQLLLERLGRSAEASALGAQLAATGWRT